VKIEGKLFPIDRANVDTDQIIPTRFLGAVDFAGLGAYCLAGLPGIEALYAAHPDATILVARENFGAGSSREHAVWALQARGFRAVIAPSFARIFEENAYNNALLAATVPEDAIEKIFRAPSAVVDASAQTITLPDGTSIAFRLDPLRKEFLLGGGFLRYMADQVPAIRDWERART
jgi:3-isopropylmalate/(R)-2-methylmalate dehydratase small subunit